MAGGPVSRLDDRTSEVCCSTEPAILMATRGVHGRGSNSPEGEASPWGRIAWPLREDF